MNTNLDMLTFFYVLYYVYPLKLMFIKPLLSLKNETKKISIGIYFILPCWMYL